MPEDSNSIETFLPRTPFEEGVALALSLLKDNDEKSNPDFSDSCNRPIAELERAIDKSNRLFAAAQIKDLLTKVASLEPGTSIYYRGWIKGIREVETILEHAIYDLKRFYTEE